MIAKKMTQLKSAMHHGLGPIFLVRQLRLPIQATAGVGHRLRLRIAIVAATIGINTAEVGSGTFTAVTSNDPMNA